MNFKHLTPLFAPEEDAVILSIQNLARLRGQGARHGLYRECLYYSLEKGRLYVPQALLPALGSDKTLSDYRIRNLLVEVLRTQVSVKIDPEVFVRQVYELSRQRPKDEGLATLTALRDAAHEFGFNSVKGGFDALLDYETRRREYVEETDELADKFAEAAALVPEALADRKTAILKLENRLDRLAHAFPEIAGAAEAYLMAKFEGQPPLKLRQGRLKDPRLTEDNPVYADYCQYRSAEKARLGRLARQVGHMKRFPRVYGTLQQVAALERKLEALVQAERYEEAAAVRDALQGVQEDIQRYVKGRAAAAKAAQADA